MKLVLTAKETRKLTSAIATIEAAVNKVPFVSGRLASVKTVDHKFTVNTDGTSELEVHEKSFSTFLESGAELFVATGNIVRNAISEFGKVFSNFDNDMQDAAHSIEKRGEGYAKPMPKPEHRGKGQSQSPLTSAQEAILKAVVSDMDFDPLNTYAGDDLPFGVKMGVLPSDSPDVPYHLRLAVAARMVQEKKLRFYQAVKQFDVKDNDLRNILNG